MHADKTYNVLKKIHIIDRVGLMSMGLFSICYILFSSPFAELHIQPPFLDFPVFVGEILLFMCLILFAVRCKLSPLKLNKWHYALIAYFLFVVVKGLLGYIGWGPMGLRDAALLYYSMFAVLGYYFYRKDFFSEENFFFIGPLFILAFIKIISESYVIYWTFSGVLLAAVFIKGYPDKRVRYSLWVLLLFLIPYTRLFLTSRMMIVSNTIAMLYLILAFFFILRFRRSIKVLMGILSMFLFILGIFTFSDPVRARTIISFGEVLATFNENDKIVQEGIGSFKIVEVKKLELYQPEGKSLTRDYEQKLKIFKVRQEQVELARINHEKVQAQERQIAPVATNNEVLTEQKRVQERISGIGEQGVLPRSQQKDVVVVTAQEGRVNLIRSVSTTSNEVLVKKKRVQERISGIGEQGVLPQSRQKDVVAVTAQERPIDPVFPTTATGDEILAEQNRTSVAAQQSVVPQEDVIPIVAPERQSVQPYQPSTGLNNAVFRLFIWRDMLVELAKERPILGFDFGKPLRSISLEILGWGWSNWGGQGWMPAHNSYLNIIYRAGIIGVLFLLTVFVVLFNMIREFIRSRSVIGILLCGVLINWFVAANFLLILELPYTAIPIWSLYGITLAYCYKKEASEYELAK